MASSNIGVFFSATILLFFVLLVASSFGFLNMLSGLFVFVFLVGMGYFLFSSYRGHFKATTMAGRAAYHLGLKARGDVAFGEFEGRNVSVLFEEETLNPPAHFVAIDVNCDCEDNVYSTKDFSILAIELNVPLSKKVEEFAKIAVVSGVDLDCFKNKLRLHFYSTFEPEVLQEALALAVELAAYLEKKARTA
ncbi:MAG: hypothetical protein V1834_00125 [Candidatus Micrarchaeota archaeon]